MLFTSFEFLFLFFPVVIVLYFFLNRHSRRWGIATLAAASLFFYGWWNPWYLILLCGSIVFNYCIGNGIVACKNAEMGRRAKAFLVLGIVVNVSLLLYYKYLMFAVDSFNFVFNCNFVVDRIVLPLGISFFTFTETAYIVDCYNKSMIRYGFLNYVLFVTYFPHLIAGPIIHHEEVMPQFNFKKKTTFNTIDMSVGLALLAFGLLKKVLIADNIAPIADAVFRDANAREFIGPWLAWKGAIAYTLQLYFDFSGYSDMAVGLSRTIGVKLPVNFHSPYKASCIIDFWQRWHRTLSRFIRDYLYFPLGGSRLGAQRKYVNLVITMLLAGAWHGAGVTYVIWGLMHAVYLVVNHVWRDCFAVSLKLHGALKSGYAFLSRGLSFVAVVFAWVMFRADSVKAGLVMYLSMLDMKGMHLPNFFLREEYEKFAQLASSDSRSLREIVLLCCCLCIVWFLPNTQQIMRRFSPAIGLYGDRRSFWLRGLVWQPNLAWGVAVGVCMTMALSCVLSSYKNEYFLYFQF